VPPGLEVELDAGCAAEPNMDADGEGEPDELPPTIEAPPEVPVPDTPPPPGHEEEDEGRGEEEEKKEEGEEENPRPGTGPAGTASESTNTSPRTYSTFWAGTPDWFSGWVNATCTPVALTVFWPEVGWPGLVVPVPAPV
jgi:hypothetical protein